MTILVSVLVPIKSFNRLSLIGECMGEFWKGFEAHFDSG